MIAPAGYAQIVDPDRPLVEYDTAVCCHCSAIIFTKPNTLSTVYLIPQQQGGIFCWREEPGAGCWKCGGRAICLTCYSKGVCVPLERWLEQVEAQSHSHSQRQRL